MLVVKFESVFLLFLGGLYAFYSGTYNDVVEK